MAIKKGISIIIFGLAIFSMGPQHLFSEENLNSDETIKEICNNVSEEYVTCAAFYMIAAEGLRRSGYDEAALAMEKASDTALQYALVSAQEGRTQEMAHKVTLARLELTIKSMTKEIDNDITNISILMNEYGNNCKEIMEDPDKPMSEWSEKILKRHELRD